jgi:hypothetical protein
MHRAMFLSVRRPVRLESTLDGQHVSSLMSVRRQFGAYYGLSGIGGGCEGIVLLRERFLRPLSRSRRLRKNRYHVVKPTDGHDVPQMCGAIYLAMDSL